MSQVHMVTDQNYEEVVAKSDKPVFLAIGAMWCVDCQRIAPFFGQFAEKYGDKLLFASCMFDENPGIKEKFDVRHIPTLVLLKDGKECGRAVGYRDYKSVNDFIDM